MMKKSKMIAGLAVAALACAIPTSAASAEWTTLGVPLSGDEEIELIGVAGPHWVGAETGIHWTMKLKATLTAGTTKAEVTSVKDTNCTGTGPGLGGLRCTATPVGLPWLMRWNGSALEITGFKLIHYYYHPADTGHTTPLTTTTLTGIVLANPDNSAAIGSVELEGASMEWNGGVGGFSGTLVAHPAGHFGVE